MRRSTGSAGSTLRFGYGFDGVFSEVDLALVVRFAQSLRRPGESTTQYVDRITRQFRENPGALWRHPQWPQT